MKKDLTFLQKQIEIAIKNIEFETQYQVQRIVYRILEGVAKETPVDTGLARSNWRVSVDGQMVGGKRPAFAPGLYLGKKENANLDAMLAFEKKNIRNNRDTEGTIYIYNTAPHTAELNYLGKSPQSPKYFVEETVKKVLDSIK